MVRRHSENTLGLLNQCSEVSLWEMCSTIVESYIVLKTTNDNSAVITCWFLWSRIKVSRVEPSGGSLSDINLM